MAEKQKIKNMRKQGSIRNRKKMLIRYPDGESIILL
jgi:hypothetical protein